MVGIVAFIKLVVVLEHLPSQQGLRLVAHLLLLLYQQCTRTSSITTRIKTCKIASDEHVPTIVLEHLPSQQGLRLNTVN